MVGVVVAYDDMEKMVSITGKSSPFLLVSLYSLCADVAIVDDGSGYLMDLVVWKGEPPTGRKPKFSFDDLKEVSLHSIIKAKGSLGEFRGNKQLLLRRIAVLHDTNDEVDAWTETIKFKKNVLSKPWHLAEEFINEERGRVMGAIEEEERRKEKKRRKDEQTLRRKEKELEKAAREEKRKGKAVEESARGNQVGAEGATTEVGYRGRRRVTGPEKSEPLLPGREPLDHPTSQREETSQPPALESIYRGRRRQSPRPWPSSVSPDLKPADGSAPTLAQASRPSKLQPLNTHCSELDEYGQEPSYKRRRYSPPTLELGLQPSSQRSEILESSFRGCRRSSRAPLQLTVSNITLLESSTSSEFLAGAQSQPSAGAGSYVGRRRTRSESASIIQGLHENHPPSKLETIPSSPPRVVRKSRSSRYSPRRLRVPRTDAPRGTSPGADFPQPMPEKVPSSIESSTSIYRGRRRRAGSETASVVDPTTVPTISRTKPETVEPPPLLSALAECPSEPSYRGRRRRGETATSSQPSRGSSIFLNPVEEKSDYGRWAGSTVSKDPALPSSPPGDGDGSRYRGRRRAQIS